MYKTIVEAVLNHAVQTPDKLAVAFKKDILNYRQLANGIYQFASILKKEYGVEAGDRIMISALSKPSFVVAHFAAQFTGAVSVPVDKAATQTGLSKLYKTVRPKLFLTDVKIEEADINKVSLKDLYQRATEEEPAEKESIFAAYPLPDPDAIAEIIFTTGTTGNPKGAMLSYESLLYSTRYTAEGIGRKVEDVELLPLPLNHSFGLRVLRALLYLGASAVLQNGFMFPKEMKENIRAFSCTGISCVPASVERLYQNMGEAFYTIMSGFRYMEISAGSLSLGMKQKLLNVLPQVQLFNVWGSSETGGVFFLDVSAHPEHMASIGVAASDVEVCMVDPAGNRYVARSADQAGRLAVKGKMQMSGYFDLPDETNKTLVDGYLYTGDLAYLTEDGYVYMLGRADDIIKVAGENVSPLEVENTASLYEGIEECACIGVADPEGLLGQVPVLYVVPGANAYREEELMDFLKSRLEPYKLPQHFRLINQLPRNAMKKVDRKKLTEIWQQGTNENEVINAIYRRRSIREFTGEHIPREVLKQIAECGMQAPSGHNMQTWHFSVVSKGDAIERLKAAIGPVAKRRGVYYYGFHNPDALILISNDVRNRDGIQDSSCAAMNIMLAAHSLGIGSVWLNPLMTICDEPEIREILTELGVPEGYNVWAMIALGYPARQASPLAKITDVINWVE